MQLISLELVVAGHQLPSVQALKAEPKNRVLTARNTAGGSQAGPAHTAVTTGKWARGT